MNDKPINNKGKITFKHLTLDGKHQKEWFKIFDLLDKIFPDIKKTEVELNFNRCKIQHFRFISKELPKGSTKREFALWVKGEMTDNKVCEWDRKTGKITWFKLKG